MMLRIYFRMALCTEGFFPDPITSRGKGGLEVHIDGGLELLGSAYCFRKETIFCRVADLRVVSEKEGNVSDFLSSIAKSSLFLKGRKEPSCACPDAV